MQATLAKRGSQRWLQIAVNHAPESLNVPLRRAMRLPEGEGIEWRSPLAKEGYIEYRDGAFVDLLGVTLDRRSLFDFWPVGGPMWDALGTTSSGECILVEAKAHIGEMISPASRASAASLEKIKASLREVQSALAPRSPTDWSGTFYQYANRIAHLYLLRQLNGVPAHLVFLCFVNAYDVHGPKTVDEWMGAIKLVEGYLGLGRHRLSRFIHHVFVDVNTLPQIIDDRPRRRRRSPYDLALTAHEPLIKYASR